MATYPIEQFTAFYPSPACSRLTPVPDADVSWISRMDGEDFTKLSKIEQARSKGTNIANVYNAFPLIGRVIKLREGKDSTAPGKEAFNRARADIGKGGIVPPTIAALDLNLLRNHVGYARMPTGEAYYFKQNLQLPETAPGSKQYKGRLYLSVFTEQGHVYNSAHSIVETFAAIRREKLGKERIDKACLLVLLRIVLRIYGVLNKRILYQKPEAGTVYSEADQPFVLAIFEQRDLSCQVNFETSILTPALANYKELDMVKFATTYSFAEFFWLCCGFLRCIAAEMKVEIFSDDAVEMFCQTHINEHWAVYMTQLHIREVKVDGLNELLNQRADELSCNIKRTKFTAEEKNVAKATRAFTVVDTNRTHNERSVTAALAFGKDDLHKCNWVGFLGKYSLLAWNNLDPARPDWDLSLRHIKSHFDDPERFVRDVAVAQFLLLHSSFSFTVDDELRPHNDAFPPVNTLRLTYSMVFSKHRRLCFTPPLAESNESLVAPAITSPLNMQFPCWAYLVNCALQAKPAARDDMKRRRHVLVSEGAEGAKVLADGETGGWLDTSDGAIQELFHKREPNVDLLWRINMVRNSGYFLSHSALTPDPTPSAELKTIPWNSPARPLPSTFTREALRQAAFMRINKHPGLTEDTEDLCDKPVKCWNMYRMYLQGCVLYRNEVDVIRHVLATFFGSMEAFTLALAKNATDLLYSLLSCLQWGERLWRQMVYTSAIHMINPETAPETRAVRKQFLKAYPLHSRHGTFMSHIKETFFKNSHPQVAESALLERPAFWKELLRLYHTQLVKPSTEEAEEEVFDAHENEPLLNWLASNEITTDPKQTFGSTLVIRSHILPRHHVVCPVMRHELKSPMGSYDSRAEMVATLRQLAIRRFVQPLCLLASIIYPPSSATAVLYTSPIDGKTYPWAQLQVPRETDPFVVAVQRRCDAVIKTALVTAMKDDCTNWVGETEAIGFKPTRPGFLSSLSDTLTSIGAQPVAGRGKKKKTEPAKDGPEYKDFVAATLKHALRQQTDKTAEAVIRASLGRPRTMGQQRCVDPEAVDCVLLMYTFLSAPGGRTASDMAFSLLRSYLNAAEMTSTLKRLSEAKSPLFPKLQLFLGIQPTPAPPPPTPRDTNQTVAAAAAATDPKGFDPTARREPTRIVDDFGAEDEEDEVLKSLIGALDDPGPVVVAETKSESSNNAPPPLQRKRPMPEPALPVAKRSRIEPPVATSNSNSNSNASAQQQPAAVKRVRQVMFDLA